ncbi:glycosyltransferase family 39 protein [Streptomyces luteocolor]|uniref:glycosyltransferase family 39 protein n=1 Tax=Streptomyces luteocolor TaxID=285500 RepID=UPI003F7768F0
MPRTVAERLPALLASPFLRVPLLASLVPALVMLALGLWGLERGAVWRDEGATLQVARRSLPEIWHLLHHVDAVHGLYYALMHVLLPADPGAFALRLPSVLAASATAALVAALGTRLARPRVGLWAGLLYAVTPLAGHYAQEGRSYALVAAGAALATLLLVRAAGRPGRRAAWCAYAAVAAGTVLLHELAALLLLAHAVTLLLSRVPRSVWRGWAAAAGGVCVLLLPLLLVSGGQSAQVSWLVPPDGAAAGRLLRAFAGPTTRVLACALVLAAVALVPPWRGGAGGRGPGRGRLALPAVALPLLVLPPAVLFAVSQRWPLYQDRYVLFALAGLPLLVAAGADRVVRGAGGLARRARFPRARFVGGPGFVRGLGPVRRRRSARPGFARPGFVRPGLVSPGFVRRLRFVRPRGAVAVLGAAAVGLALWWQLPLHRLDRAVGHGREDPAAASAVAARVLRPGEPVLFLPAMARRVALAHPDGFRGARDLALGTSPAASGTLYGTEVGPAELRRRLAAADRVWVLTEPPVLRETRRRIAGAEGAPKTDRPKTDRPKTDQRETDLRKTDLRETRDLKTEDLKTEQIKLALLHREFTPRAAPFVVPGATLRLYVRR